MLPPDIDQMPPPTPVEEIRYVDSSSESELATRRKVIALFERDPDLLDQAREILSRVPWQLTTLQQDILSLSDRYTESLTADFPERDALPQTRVAEENWFLEKYGTWGPRALHYPPVDAPPGCNALRWRQDRIIAVAEKYTGLPYKRWSDEARAHFPARGCGLDCSNFVSWVYNYGLGIHFTSNVDRLAIKDPSDPQFAANAGRWLAPDEVLQKGDLIIMSGDPKHVTIYIDEHSVIDSTSRESIGVARRDLRDPDKSRYIPLPSNPRFMGVRRPLDGPVPH